MPIPGAPTRLGTPATLSRGNVLHPLLRTGQAAAGSCRPAALRPRASSKESVFKDFSIPSPSPDSLWSDVLEIPHLRDQLGPR
jgi:hypothetical protein